MPATLSRLARLRIAMREQGVSAAFLTSLVNIRYLTGFTGSNAALLVTDDQAVLATDARYTLQATAEAIEPAGGQLTLLVERDTLPALAAYAATLGVRELAVEERVLTLAEDARLREHLPTTRLGPLVEQLRVVKDDTELAALTRACQISIHALGWLAGQVRPGVTERQLAIGLDRTMVDLGADEPAFDTIVASGPHSAIPHHRPGQRPLTAGDLLTVDFGAAVDGYHADCTRTWVVAADPAPWQQQIHALVEAAAGAGRAAARPGTSAADVDAAARQVIAEGGYGEQFVHGLGHGVGLQVHEEPLLAPGVTHTLQAGTPVTIEPGIYLPGRGGVRIEDTVVVTDGAGPQVLTDAPRSLDVHAFDPR